MKSRWYELKEKATTLRKRGISIIKIEADLGIPRSTLSGWFKNIKLTKKQKNTLLQNQKTALTEARKKAVLWHNAQKKNRLKEAENEATKTLEKVDLSNSAFLELALAFLYLGEGSKKNLETSIGSSNPQILKLFLTGLKNIYNINRNEIRCELYLRFDQDPVKIKKYWSKTLSIPLVNFKQATADKRTEGSTTYSHYKGVCNLRCGRVSIQRRLMFLANLFCDKIISENKGV
jgi:hypothetical protein